MSYPLGLLAFEVLLHNSPRADQFELQQLEQVPKLLAGRSQRLRKLHVMDDLNSCESFQG